VYNAPHHQKTGNIYIRPKLSQLSISSFRLTRGDQFFSDSYITLEVNVKDFI